MSHAMQGHPRQWVVAGISDKTVVYWKRERQEEKGMTEDEMVGWHHQLNGHEFAQAPGYSEGQGGLACCSPWGCRVRHDLATKQKQRS